MTTSEAITLRLCPARHPRSWKPSFLHESLSSGRLRSFKPHAQRKQSFHADPFYVKGQVSACVGSIQNLKDLKDSSHAGGQRLECRVQGLGDRFQVTLSRDPHGAYSTSMQVAPSGWVVTPSSAARCGWRPSVTNTATSRSSSASSSPASGLGFGV